MKNTLSLVVVSCAALCAATCSAETNTSAIKHRFLAEDESRAQLLLVDQRDSTQNWAVKFPDRYRDYQLIGGNRVMLNTSNGFREYDLKTRDMVREVKDAALADITTARRLPDGRTILGGNRKGITFYEMGPDDKILRTANFAGLNTLRLVRQSPRGTLLFGANGNKAVEADLDGKVIREVVVEGAKHIYQVLEKPDGNWLVATGYGGSIAEIDRAGKVVRKVGGSPAPAGLWLNFFCGFQVLKNGNIVVCNWTGHDARDSEKAPQLLEYAPDGSIVWQWHDAANAGSLHGVLVLDDLDTAVLNDDVSSVMGAVKPVK
ncbi:MAG: hypothetical protein WCN95_06870 [bacterium]